MILQKLRKNKKGFTLVELIVVLVILAILIGALTPTMIGFIKEARGKALIAEARVGLLAAQMIIVEDPAAVSDTNWHLAPATGSSVTNRNTKFNNLTEDVTSTTAGLSGVFSKVTVDANGHVTGITYARSGTTVVILDGKVTVTTS